MGIFKKFVNSMSEPDIVHGIPKVCKFDLFGKERILKTNVIDYISDEHSKELYELFLSSLNQIEEGLKAFISNHYDECIDFYCEGLPLPDDQDSVEYSDIKLLLDEWNARNMIDGDSYDETEKKGLDSMLRLLNPNEMYIKKDHIFLGVFANKFDSEGFEVTINADGVKVGFLE